MNKVIYTIFWKNEARKKFIQIGSTTEFRLFDMHEEALDAFLVDNPSRVQGGSTFMVLGLVSGENFPCACIFKLSELKSYALDQI